LDRIIEFWEGLGDPSTSNAALHDFARVLAIAMCAVLRGGHGAVDMDLFAKSKEPSGAGSSSSRMAYAAMTPQPAFRMLDPQQSGGVSSLPLSGRARTELSPWR